MSGMRVAWIHVRVGVLNEMQYRANFFIQLVQSTVTVATGLIALAVIFGHTSDLNGWSRPELIVVMGVYTLVGGLIGFGIEPNMGRVLADIHQGTFDVDETAIGAGVRFLAATALTALWEGQRPITGEPLLAVNADN